MILGFTNCSIDLIGNVCVFVVVVFNVIFIVLNVVVVVVVVEGVSKFFSYLEMSNLELAFLEPCRSFPSKNPNVYAKGTHTRRRKHTTHSTKSRE